ncbi:hypothetical protein QBC43DRAFT_125766 [Cladorrhinum sp. PSN259]|nr:hypothetical protein QBC43DRAFT_125766 [Cladorrhinum sp. PSN259]
MASSTPSVAPSIPEDEIAELSLEKSPRDSVEAVLKDLLSARVPGYDLRTQYIPIQRLESILNYDTIKAILLECLGLDNNATDDDHTTELATLICGTETSTEMVLYRKSLAVLILSNMESKLQTFLDHRLADSKLPFYKKLTSIGEYQLCLRDSATPLPFLTGWDSDISALFYEEQWLVVAPFFRRPTKTNAE